MSERTQRLKKKMLDVIPCVSAERLVLATEAYRKYAGEAIPVFRAEVLNYVLENKKIEIREDELIVGDQADKQRCAPLFPEYQSESEWLYSEIVNLEQRTKDPMVVSDEDRKKILLYLPWWKNKSMEDITNKAINDDIKEDEEEGIYTLGGRDSAPGQTLPYYDKLLKMGLKGYIEECRANIRQAVLEGENINNQKKIDFWNSCIIVCHAAINYAHRYSDLAKEMAAKEKNEERKKELDEISVICGRVPENRPQSFREALQFVWFIHLMSHIESNSTGNGFGRFDQYMYEFYKADKDKGLITDDQVVELLEMFYIKITGMIKIRTKIFSNAFAGYPMWQILMIGGQTIHGKDASNELSYFVLDACKNIRMAQPAIALRVFDGTPEALMQKAVKMIQQGLANPAFFNDKSAIPMVLEKGGSLVEARDWAIVGCVEPHPGKGSSDASPLSSYMNGLKNLELVLHNGINPLTGRKAGLETGDPLQFTCRQNLIDATEKQLAYFYTRVTGAHNLVMSHHATRLPVIFASMVIDGCMQQGKAVQQGGAKHTYTGIFICGPANIADSIVAIDYAVFKNKIVTMKELIDALDHNFEGQERLRQYLLNVPPKYGNDNAEVDAVYTEIIDFIADYVQKINDARGGKYCLCNLSQTANVMLGKSVGATPDGRFAYDPLSDNASPAMGRDISGPTATVNSVSHTDQISQWDGMLFNLRFDPSGVKGDKGVEIIEGIIKTYFENYGTHIQINVVDDKTLRAAQKNPENYRDLLVRVAGYLAYFTEIDKDVQDSIIERTAHLRSSCCG